VTYDLTVTNNTATTTEAAGYTFYEVVPAQTTFTGISGGTTNCALPAPAGKLCTITVSNAVPYGTPQVVKLTFTLPNPLNAGTTQIMNVATQDTIAPPPCVADVATGICASPPPNCAAGGNLICAPVATVTPLISVAKTVDGTTPGPIAAGGTVIYDLTVTNSVVGTVQPVGYTFYEVVPQQTTLTAISGGTSTDCASLPAAAGKLCTISVSNPVANGVPQVVKLTFTLANPLNAGTTQIMNVATQDTVTKPCTPDAVTGICASPPTSCAAGTNQICAPVSVLPSREVRSPSGGTATYTPAGLGGTPPTLVLTCTPAATQTGPGVWDAPQGATCTLSVTGGVPPSGYVQSGSITFSGTGVDPVTGTFVVPASGVPDLLAVVPLAKGTAAGTNAIPALDHSMLALLALLLGGFAWMGQSRARKGRRA
jgi:hypothetical protein